MGNENIIELILQARDLASEALERLRGNLAKLPAEADNINAAFKDLKILPTAELEAQKTKIIAAYEQIKNSATSTASDITRAEAAKNKAIEDLNSRNFANQGTLLDFLKEHYIAVTGAIIAAWAGISKAMEYADIGAAALQSEESFRNVTQAYEVDGDKLLAKMKEVSVGAIDDSELMQRAVKALQQGLNPDQIVSLLEVARSSARVAGTDIASAFDRIAEATANQMTRGLKSMGLIIDQNKAYADYAKALGIAKDALNEQQQSQALANAAVTEGLRQAANMNMSLITEAEQLQINKARFNEIKESIGKDFVAATIAAKENTVGLGVALGAGTLINAPALIKAISTAMQGNALASGAAAMGLNGLLAAASAFAGYKIGDEFEKWSSGYNDIVADTERLQASQKKLDSTLSSSLALLGFSGPDAWAKYEQAMKSGNLIVDQTTGKQTNLVEQLKQTISIIEAQAQTLQASSQYELGLIKQDFEMAKITVDQYLAFVKNRQQQVTDAQVAAAQMRIEETKKEYQMKMISEDDMKAKVAVITEQITQIKIKGIQDYQGKQDEADKEALDKVKKSAEEQFAAWKDLQQKKLDAMKANIDLQNAIDDAAVKAGVMRESEAMQNKLNRLYDYYDAQIQKAQQTADRIAALEEQGFYKTKEARDKANQEYADALSEKERLQAELQQNIVTSSQQITAAQGKEEQDATAFVLQQTQDRIAIAENERDQKLKTLEEYYQKGLVDAQQYADAQAAIEKSFTDKTTEEVKKSVVVWTTQVKDMAEGWHAMVDYIRSSPWFTSDSLFGKDWWQSKSVFQEFADAVKEVYKDTVDTIQFAMGDIDDSWASIKASGIHGLADAQDLFKDLLWQYSTNVEGFYNYMTGAGKKIAESVGLTVEEWIGRVSDYVNYVKGLLMSLQDYIGSLRQQLMQLRGDSLGELEMWYEEEKNKLNETYGEELKNTKEYYEALALIVELYKEKKKKILDEMASDEEDSKDKSESGGASGGVGGGGSTGGGGTSGSGSVIIAPSSGEFVGNFVSSITEGFRGSAAAIAAALSGTEGLIPKEIKVSKEFKGAIDLNMPSLDKEYTRRFVRETLWPELSDYLKLMGIDLKK